MKDEAIQFFGSVALPFSAFNDPKAASLRRHMDASQLSRLLFLLSTTAVAAGCTSDGDGADDTSTSGAATGDPSTSGQGATGSIPEGSSSGETSPEPTTSGSSGSDTGSVDSSTGSASPDGTGGESELCESYAANYVQCNPQYSRYQAAFSMSCESELEFYGGYGEACRAAGEDWFACLATVDCETLASDAPCPTQWDALNQACFGGGSTGA